MVHRAFPNHDLRDFPRDLQRDFPLAGSEGGLPPGVIIAVTSFLVPNSTGNLDITTIKNLGQTPKAAYFLLTRHRSDDDAGGDSDQFVVGTGATDGTNQWWTHTSSEHNQANTDTKRIQNNDNVIVQFRPQSGFSDVEFAASFVAFIEDGIRINFTNVDLPNVRVIVVFFGGDDVEADVGVVNLGTGTSAIDITAPGFEPDVVFMNSTGNVLNSLDNALVLSQGFLINDGAAKQMSVGLTEFHNQAAGDLNTVINSTKCLVTNTYNLLGSAFDANGFSVTPSANAGSDRLLYMALKFTGRTMALVEFDTPTVTGNQTYDPGFEPQFYFGMISNIPTRDSVLDNDGVGFCVGVADNQGSASANSEFGAATTNTGCETRDVAIQGVSDTDAGAIVASLVGFTGSGAQFNYSAVRGTADKSYMFFVSAS